MKNHYRELTLTFQDVEQLSNQVLTIVGPNGQQAIRREWERVQLKSHQIQTAILKVNLFNKFQSSHSNLDRTTITKLYHRLVHFH